MIYIGFVFDVEKPDLEKYMHADFIKSMRDILRDNDAIDVNKKPDDGEWQSRSNLEMGFDCRRKA